VVSPTPLVPKSDGKREFAIHENVSIEEEQDDLASAIGELAWKDKKPRCLQMSGKGWRSDGATFKDQEMCMMTPGLATFSPAWFATGQEVRGVT
jgi:hypothetical protein